LSTNSNETAPLPGKSKTVGAMIFLVGFMSLLFLKNPEVRSVDILREGDEQEVSSSGSSRSQEKERAISKRHATTPKEKAIATGDHPEIKVVVNFLRKLEKERSRLVKEDHRKGASGGSMTIFFFEIEALDQTEKKGVLRKLEKLSHLSKELHNGDLESWPNYIRKEYYLNFSDEVLTFALMRDHQSGQTKPMVSYVDKNTKKSRTLPIPSDRPVGFPQLITHGFTWRFGHLLDYSEEAFEEEAD
jgi:hypothetical protein